MIYVIVVLAIVLAIILFSMNKDNKSIPIEEHKRTPSAPIEEPIPCEDGSIILNPEDSYKIVIYGTGMSGARLLKKELCWDGPDYKKHERVHNILQSANIRIKNHDELPETMKIEGDNIDPHIDDIIMNKYSFWLLTFYFSKSKDKIYIAPKDDKYSRPLFEELIKKNLAVSGESLSLDEILSAFTLKKLNDLVPNQEKEFKRKAQAIEYLSSLINVGNIIDNNICVGNLFKLLPAPEDIASVDIERYEALYDYYYRLADMLLTTWRYIGFSKDTIEKRKELDINSVFEVSPRVEFCEDCPKHYAEGKTYKTAPQVPCRFGCECMLDIKPED